MADPRIAEGFQGQKHWVLPRAILKQCETQPMLQGLIPTDIGWYPTARYHYRVRDHGADEHILILCVDGAGWCEIQGQQHAVNPGQALFIPRGTPHIYGASEGEPWTIHWVHFVGVESDFFIHHLPENESTIFVDPQCMSEAEALFRQCYNSFIGSFVLYRLIYCSKILHHLLAHLLFNNTSFSPGQRSNRFHSLDTTITYLHHHVKDRLTLDEIAEYAGLSVSHFSLLFKQQTGHSPMDYFIHLKMQYACGLLTLTTNTVRQIAYELGYDDPYYFSRLFKRVMGVSPNQYRQNPPT